VKFAAIADWAASDEFPVAFMCRQLGVSRSGYYAWLGAVPSQRATDDAALTTLIAILFRDGRGNLGVRRVRAGLAALGRQLSHKRVWRLMKAAGLRGRHPKAFKRTTVAGEYPVPAADLLARDFTAEDPNTRWCGDITYVKTWDGWAYVATVIDLHSRAVVGWAIADNMRTDLVISALDMAIARRRPPAGVIFHSDRGTQRGFNGSSQHLDDGGVLRWQDAGRVLLTGRCGRGCGLRAGRRLGGGSSGSSGGGSLRASRARMRRPQWACLGRSGRAGFDTVAGCPRSVSRSRRAGTCRSPSGKRSRC
jgi:hypothetical protein